MQDLYDDLLDRLNSDHSTDGKKKLFEVYGSLAINVRRVDDFFSFPAFLATFLNLFGLFWNGYRISFLTKLFEHPFYLICPVIYHLSQHLLLMISASRTNEKTAKAKLIMQCLLRHCHLETRKKMKYEKNIVLESNLTSWKIYVFDRSLLITSFGCLLTYGILLGTLGRD
ncbi:hypothetical protein CDAR_502761 [Caerostris darwini]|uniref:Uncharacterized protein n=1 Tax=Caerostris darwini TaxID=1538125 RepID=A0AAV4RDT2_9ARAC|nr:hypothetical protein CDAR_502761 [Caerostris darwini]